MKWVGYTNIPSPHSIPLANAMHRVAGEMLYVFQRRSTQTYLNSQACKEIEAESICEAEDTKRARAAISSCHSLIISIRDVGLLKERAEKRLFTAYASERWLKPISALHPARSEYAACPRALWLPGILKLAVPSIFRRVRFFTTLISDVQTFCYLPQGIRAAKDMARLCGLMHGDLMCLFKAPELDFERKPGGRIWLKNGGDGRKYCLDKMRIWGYYVKPSKSDALPVQEAAKTKPHEIKVLWVGRLLNWKRVDAIVRAVGEHTNLKRVDASLPKITLDIYGEGPEKERLKSLATRYAESECIRFHPPLPNAEIRDVMRSHDVYILGSNAFEGWGAVVSEALEEGMAVLGTYEAGACATMLPDENLFHSGDWRALLKLLQSPVKKVGIGLWTADYAAKTLMEIADEFCGN